VAGYAYVSTTTATTAPAPADTTPVTTEGDKAKQAGSVHPGANCARAGALGSTDTGTAMICSGSPARWNPT
jgi:hypothetical protein